MCQPEVKETGICYTSLPKTKTILTRDIGYLSRASTSAKFSRWDAHECKLQRFVRIA
jgi:hypothetical protein